MCLICPRNFMFSLFLRTKARSIHRFSSNSAVVQTLDSFLSRLAVSISTVMPGMPRAFLFQKTARLLSLTLPCISNHLPMYGCTNPSACASLYFSKNANSFSGSISNNSRPLVVVEGDAPIIGISPKFGAGEAVKEAAVVFAGCWRPMLNANQNNTPLAAINNTSIIKKMRTAFCRFAFWLRFNEGYLVRKTAEANALRAMNRQITDDG